MKYEEKLEILSLSLDAPAHEMIVNYLDDRSKRSKEVLTKVLLTYIDLLADAFNMEDADEWVRNLTYIRADISQRHTYHTAKSKLTLLLLFIKYITTKGSFKGVITTEFTALLTTPLNDPLYDTCQSEAIPKEISDRFSYTPTAEEIFRKVLNTSCPPEVAKRLKEHVNSFKHPKHHRTPLIEFLKQVSESNSKWYEHPRVIQGELLKFRNNMLDNYQRNSAYGRFQNVKNALSVLIEHGLLPHDTELPDNLRRCVNTQKIRKDNPLISGVNLYDTTKQQSYNDTPTFIESLKKDLSKNLSALVKEAQTIVYQGYQRFLERENVIGKSQFNEFIIHPKLLVNKMKDAAKTGPKKINPFYRKNPLRVENLTAYYDYFFDDLINNKTSHNLFDLRPIPEIHGYLGLTITVASAMQIIITEELGINPYSLYQVKVSSDRHGNEFVLVTDKGSVRFRANKPRARNASTRNAKGSLVSLSCIDTQNINAATCLKMALEMTSRSRKSSQMEELWICISKDGLSNPTPESFQNNFNKIKKLTISESKALQNATLKKVRASKAILIYLESNGDSLKAASYLGNSVKTTLARYIPQYLTELIHRLKIRSFQKIFLYMAVAFDESPCTSLNMSESEFNLHLKKAFNNPDMGGDLYEQLTNQATSNEKNNNIYFCLSEMNIELAIKYAKDGEDTDLKKRCIAVLSKISEGSVIMKQMLRKAQKASAQTSEE